MWISKTVLDEVKQFPLEGNNRWGEMIYSNLALNKKYQNQKPLFIIAHTIKGKGVSFMENKPLWHGSLKMSHKQIVSSLEELGANKKLINLCNS
jgi:transketolase